MLYLGQKPLLRDQRISAVIILGHFCEQRLFEVVDDSGYKATLEEQRIWQPDYSGLNPDTFDLAGEGNDEVTITQSAVLPDTGVAAYDIGPDTLFELPQRVWLPLPGSIPADQITIEYFGSESGGTWHPTVQVEGWLVPDSELVTELDGISYVGITVRHGATIRLRAPESNTASAAMVPQDVLVVLVALAVLVMTGRSSRKI